MNTKCISCSFHYDFSFSWAFFDKLQKNADFNFTIVEFIPEVKVPNSKDDSMLLQSAKLDYAVLILHCSRGTCHIKLGGKRNAWLKVSRTFHADLVGYVGPWQKQWGRTPESMPFQPTLRSVGCHYHSATNVNTPFWFVCISEWHLSFCKSSADCIVWRVSMYERCNAKAN